MNEKVDWDSLPTTIEVWVRDTKQLQEGDYACPRCEGTGRVQLGHADPGPNPTVRCGMCGGTQVIRKCKECHTNPIPLNNISNLCNECEDKALQHILDLEKRPEIVCSFPQSEGICGHSELQECNSIGNLVCDINKCEYASSPLTAFIEECIVKKIKGEEYCKTCVDRENCPWNNIEEK